MFLLCSCFIPASSCLVLPCLDENLQQTFDPLRCDEPPAGNYSALMLYEEGTSSLDDLCNILPTFTDLILQSCCLILSLSEMTETALELCPKLFKSVHGV